MERKYRMTRVRDGEYLLPSNDAKTLWRIYKYREEGSLHDGDKPVTGMFWGFASKPMPPENAVMDDDFWFYGWEYWGGPYRTRQEAIDDAMYVDARRMEREQEVAGQRER